MSIKIEKLETLGKNLTIIHSPKKIDVYSYSTLVVRSVDGVCYVNSTKYSNTTSRHINKALEYLRISESRIKRLPEDKFLEMIEKAN